MSVKDQRKIQEFVEQSVQEVLRAHDEVCSSTSKKSGEEHWNRLTHNITILRRRLSKLETHGYEVLSKRFDKSRPVLNETPQSFEEVCDKFKEVLIEHNAKITSAPKSDAPTSLFGQMDLFPLQGPLFDAGRSSFITTELGVCTSGNLPPSDELPTTPAALKSESLNLEIVMDELLEMMADDGERDIAAQLAEQEINMELYSLIRDTRLMLPSAIPFSKDSQFNAKIVYIISPLEFYVIKQTHLKVLQQMDSVLDICAEKLMKCSLIDENCQSENACLVLDEKYLYRGVIKVSGKREVQVYLVDYGRRKFVSRERIFPIPKCIANMAPPLAHFCTVHDVDSRALDNEAMKKFHEKATSLPEVVIRALGETRQSHGQLVEIIEHISMPVPAEGIIKL